MNGGAEHGPTGAGAPDRPRPLWPVHLGLLVGLLVLVAGAGCSKDGKSTRPGGGATAETLTAQGWAAFATGEYGDALTSFDQAIAKDAEHGPAYVGAGWARLVSAQSVGDLRGAVSSFGTAAGLGETGADALGGRAAARLAIGGDDLPGAISDAAAALSAAPDFVFEYRPSFDATDLRLIEAFAQAARARYAEALAAADLVAPSGIDAADADTWVVGGETCDTFAQAVLAYLQQLSDSECTE
jgi:tetratricopeptide (TPR) repeat protein